MQVLTTEQIRTLAPSAFAEKPISTVSEEYVFIPTTQIIEDMQELGWNCVSAKQIKLRKNKEIREGFQKHRLIFQQVDSEVVFGKRIPQIIIVTSHDGKVAFKFKLGLYELLCANGLIIQSEDILDQSIDHSIYSKIELKKTVEEYLKSIPKVLDKVNRAQQVKIEMPKAIQFSSEALAIRYPNKEKRENAALTITNLIEMRRKEDTIENLWGLYNVVQENLINPQTVEVKPKKRIRKIKNINEDLRINQGLWQLMENYMN